MFRIDHRAEHATNQQAAGQAATELAVFGAVLIFIVGTIVRTSIGNSYAQSQNFKAMRMAMLASWDSSKAATTARNNASVLFLEDRLSPDFNKYGDLDRNPFVASGAGTFSYELLYPLDPGEVASMLPIMDVYINGQYFPFTTASYANQEIKRPSVCNQPSGSCEWRQCERNLREWVGTATNGAPVNQNQFAAIAPVTLDANAATNQANNAALIFQHLANEGMINDVNWNATPYPTANVATYILSSGFIAWYETNFPGPDQGAQLSQIQSLLQKFHKQYKLFYSQAVNGTGAFTVTPPICSSHPCMDHELSADLVLGGHSNSTGDLMFDLQRLGTYTSDSNYPTFVPLSSGGAPNKRQFMAWEWSATAGTTPELIGLNSSNNQYPQYDIDGRLQVVTINAITPASNGDPVVSYEDFQHGDIDGTWSSQISCGPKPGLMNDAQIFTYTKEGTYLQILEGGKLYNPVTDQYVVSTNQRNTIDLIQRQIQLSANTGRFCNTANPPSWGTLGKPASVSPKGTNPVEICVNGTGCHIDGDPSSPAVSGPYCSCFSSQTNVKSTCLDVSSTTPMLYVRSRVEDRRGRFWTTDISGQLQVNQQ